VYSEYEIPVFSNMDGFFTTMHIDWEYCRFFINSLLGDGHKFGKCRFENLVKTLDLLCSMCSPLCPRITLGIYFSIDIQSRSSRTNVSVSEKVLPFVCLFVCLGGQWVPFGKSKS